jgi:hypothetical protein
VDFASYHEWHTSSILCKRSALQTVFRLAASAAGGHRAGALPGSVELKNLI